FPPGFYPTEGMTQQDIAERLRVTKIDAVNSVPITFTSPVDLITVIDYLCGRYVSWIDGQKGNSLYEEAGRALTVMKDVYPNLISQFHHIDNTVPPNLDNIPYNPRDRQRSTPLQHTSVHFHVQPQTTVFTPIHTKPQ